MRGSLKRYYKSMSLLSLNMLKPKYFSSSRPLLCSRAQAFTFFANAMKWLLSFPGVLLLASSPLKTD
jgi:hypothetical protein